MNVKWLYLLLCGMLPGWGDHISFVHPIDCGAARAVPFDGAVSKDGRYAFGWTIRAAQDAKPVDWSLWKADDPFSLPDRYLLDPDSSENPSDYTMIDCLIDLRKRTLLELPSEEPDFPGKNRGRSAVLWSDAHDGRSYALIQNDSRFYTANLWLVTLDQTGMHQSDIVPALGKIVHHLWREKRPLQADDGATFFPLASSRGFVGSTIELAFSCDVPKLLYPHSEVDGVLTVKLPEGKVVKTVCDTRRDDPLDDVPSLAEADRELNQVYGQLQNRLSPVQRAALKKEQLDWIRQRDFDAYQAVATQNSDGSEDIRNESLLKTTQDRMAELKKRVAGKE